MSWIRRLLGNLGMSPDGDLGAQPPFPAGPSTSPAAEKAPLGPGGARLAETLRASGIDPATLEVLFPRGEGSVHVLRVHGSRVARVVLLVGLTLSAPRCSRGSSAPGGTSPGPRSRPRR